LPLAAPVVFTPEFLRDSEKTRQWAAFRNKNQNYAADVSLEVVCKEIENFLMVIESLNGKRALAGN
jgi:hypothetical protein